MHARSTTIVVVSAVLGFLATLTVGLRFWARHIKSTKFGLDDVLLLLALVSCSKQHTREILRPPFLISAGFDLGSGCHRYSRGDVVADR